MRLTLATPKRATSASRPSMIAGLALSASIRTARLSPLPLPFIGYPPFRYPVSDTSPYPRRWKCLAGCRAQSAHGQGSCRLPTAKVARAETGPAAEGAGEAARILEPELVGNPRQRTGRVGHQAQGGVATYLIQQAFVAGAMLTEQAAQVAGADPHGLGNLLFPQHAAAHALLYGLPGLLDDIGRRAPGKYAMQHTGHAMQQPRGRLGNAQIQPVPGNPQPPAIPMGHLARPRQHNGHAAASHADGHIGTVDTATPGTTQQQTPDHVHQGCHVLRMGTPPRVQQQTGVVPGDPQLHTGLGAHQG